MEEVTEKNSSLKKEFESLLVKDLGNRHFKEGEIISGKVSRISKKYVFVDIMAKSEIDHSGRCSEAIRTRSPFEIPHSINKLASFIT